MTTWSQLKRGDRIRFRGQEERVLRVERRQDRTFVRTNRHDYQRPSNEKVEVMK